MTRSELIHGLIVAGAPFTLFVAFMLAVIFVPVSTRKRLTPWVLGVFGAGLIAFLIPSIVAGKIGDLALPLVLIGLAFMESSTRVKARGLAYGAVAIGGLAIVAAGLIYFVPAFLRGEVRAVAALILAGAFGVPTVLAWFKIKEIRAGQTDATAEHHPMGTGTTA